MKRRELFGSLVSSFKKEEKQERVIRPPYFNEIDSFDKGCLTCENECATFCEENIIFMDDVNRPFIDFSKGGCTYCDECAKNCPNDVLKVEFKKQIDLKIEIDILSCMSWHNTMCFSCQEPCYENAIEFIGMFRPTINTQTCTSCGFCVNICPSSAIKIV